ncbi:MAG: SRPBCC domain-containing protein [Comamonadaceae bacterium]|nr:MAG: SRPBCC domain-containing protein [Comamonadaceae bacterium]
MSEPHQNAFVIVREFSRPLAAVWKAWSDAGELQQWWGPKGCTIDVHRLEFQPGGIFHYSMNFPGAPAMWGRFNYRDIVAPQRIVWLNSFSNEQGGITRAPFAEACPLEIENTATFDGQGDRTTVTVRAVPFGATAAEVAFFQALKPSMVDGYGGTLDRLEAHLK